MADDVVLAPRAFMLRVVLWLVIVFVSWAWLAPLLQLPVAWLAEPVLQALQPGVVIGVEAGRSSVDIVTAFDASMIPSREQAPGQANEVILSLNALKYGYGLPLIIALTLAAEGASARRRLLCVLGGALLVLVVQLWGIVFELQLTLSTRLGPQVAKAAGLTAMGREAVALGYQMGYLILAPVAPVVWWGAWHLPEVARLGLPGRVHSSGLSLP